LASSEDLLERLSLFGTRLGLASTRSLLEALGDPQARLSVALVAGTNGKGSTAALLSSMGSQAGYRTGLYTSPHLEQVHERVRVDGRAIDEPALRDRLERVLEAAAALRDEPVTYFEALTAAALLYFAEREVELAVLEVGLGGRLDATNVTEPLLALITEIALDHREHLGETLSEIAFEKAGVLRTGRPALARVSEGDARRVLVQRAAEVGAELRFVDGALPEGLCPSRSPLAGAHQLANLALAAEAAHELRVRGWERFDTLAIRDGAAACRWPGRLEWVEPTATAVRVLLDGAHNPAAIAALTRYLERQVGRHTLVFGAMRDKEVERMLPPLAAAAERVLITAADTPRARPPAELAPLGGERAEVVEGVEEALETALDGLDPIVVTGSLHLVGEMRSTLHRRFGVPRPAAELRTWQPSAGQPGARHEPG
jgi:dihydrofolate synthase/folylpolyglutamate synthase